MGLSSNILWHQTKEAEFYAIIESMKLLYAYSLETIKARDEILSEAFPMISLADLPFSELDFYLNCDKYDRGDAKFKTYGGYIFGFRREWGIRNKFSPVWYCETYHEGLCRIVANWKDNHGDVFLYHLIGNIKNNEGEWPEANLDSYRFYNEREYRRLFDGGNVSTLTADGYADYKKEHQSPLLEPRQGIDFSVDDILYIIVPDEQAREKFYGNQTEEWSRLKVFTRDEVNQNFIGIRHHHIKPAVNEKKSDAKAQSIPTSANSGKSAIKNANAQTSIDTQSFGTQNHDGAVPVQQMIRMELDTYDKTSEQERVFDESNERKGKNDEDNAKLTSQSKNVGRIKKKGIPRRTSTILRKLK